MFTSTRLYTRSMPSLFYVRMAVTQTGTKFTCIQWMNFRQWRNVQPSDPTVKCWTTKLCPGRTRSVILLWLLLLSGHQKRTSRDNLKQIFTGCLLWHSLSVKSVQSSEQGCHHPLGLTALPTHRVSSHEEDIISPVRRPSDASLTWNDPRLGCHYYDVCDENCKPV